MIRFVFGVGLALAALLGAFFLEGGSAGWLLGLAAFSICFFVPLFGAWAVWDLKTWGTAWVHAFRPASRNASRPSIEVWRFSEFACYLAGVLGALVGGILILQSLPDSSNSWNRALAALLVAPVYGLFFGLVCRILRFRIEALTQD